MKSQPKRCLKDNAGLFKRALKTVEDPFILTKSCVDALSPELAKPNLTYEYHRELGITLAKYEAQKSEIIHKIQTRIL